MKFGVTSEFEMAADREQAQQPLFSNFHIICFLHGRTPFERLLSVLQEDFLFGLTRGNLLTWEPT